MFSFFHRTPTITVDCFTSDQNAYNYTPIVPASKTLPKWYKELPSIRRPDGNIPPPYIYSNMRKCYAFTELFKRGFVIEAWADYVFNVNKLEYKCESLAQKSPGSHPTKQYRGGFENFHHCKINSPWHFKEKTGAQFLWLAAEWNIEFVNCKILPGVIRFDVNVGTDVNVFFPKHDHMYYVNIKVGQPLVQLIPIGDKNVKIKCHLIDESEMRRIGSGVVSFAGVSEKIKLLKRNKERNESKCPFKGFWTKD